MVEGLFTGNNYLTAKRLMDATAMRHAALASNIANVETPGYKRVDLDPSFDAQLKEASISKDTETLKTMAPKLVEDPFAAAVRPDGNNVTLDRELMETNKNATDYQFLAQLLSSNLMQLRNAIKNEGSN